MGGIFAPTLFMGVNTGLLFALLALAGCGSTGPPEHLTEGRRALRFFERGQYEECVKAFREWLLLYDRDHPDDGASARFFIGLAYKKMGTPMMVKMPSKAFIAK